LSKYIFVVGGVYSGTGKGISAASIGLLLKMRGAEVNLIKCDPYLNLNAGTMNPRQHGEVFLCDDGSETDLDLGHYERLAGITVTSDNIFTSGTLYKEILEQEEQGKFLGETVQIVPHVTNAIQDKLRKVGEGFDVVIAEIGGTVGDFESGSFYEAISQFKHQNPEDIMVLMVAPVIYNSTVKEFKTKPLQNAVRELRHSGLIPEMIFCRCDRGLSDQILDKVSRLTGVPRGGVFEAPDVSTIYEVPLKFYDRHVDDLIADRFHLPRKGVRIRKYRELVERYIDGHDFLTVNIGIVGKYDNCDEAYLSLKEALTHAAVEVGVKHHIEWINAEELEEAADMRSIWRRFEGVHGVIVPGGFDGRAVEGKMTAIRYCREKEIPFLGICLGLQCAVIEFARNVIGVAKANSSEFSDNGHVPYIHFVQGQSKEIKKSGTMRLGAYDCELAKDSIVRDLYGKKTISERHRHRYEVNNDYLKEMADKGFMPSGINPNTGLVEIMELKGHPYFIGTQAHPEFRSRLDAPAPLFVGLIKAALSRLNNSNG
jgi:CTP synthase